MNIQLSRRVVKAALVFSVLAFQSLLTSCRSSVGSDTYLTGVFFKDASDFNRILAMLSQDPHIQRIDLDFVTLDTGALWKEGDPAFSNQRWDEYRILFRKVGLQNGVGRQNGNSPVVFFYARCNGTAITRDCKGYAYSEKALAPTKNSLDRLAPGMFYKRLDGGWYLFRDGD
jgi:hypothetical protein